MADEDIEELFRTSAEVGPDEEEDAPEEEVADEAGPEEEPEAEEEEPEAPDEDEAPVDKASIRERVPETVVREPRGPNEPVDKQVIGKYR